MTLSSRIHALLARDEDLRPADLARIAGVSTASVSGWMTGDTKSMKPEPARRLAAHFGCDQNWLMTGIGAPNWREGDGVATTPHVHTAEPVTVRQAVAAIRKLLMLGDDAGNEKIGEALKRLSMGPDSDRTFEHVVSLLSALK